MGYPILEDPDSLGKAEGERCDWCDGLKEDCGCGKPDPDAEYDRMMEEW